MLPSSIKTFLKAPDLKGPGVSALRKKLALPVVLCAAVAVLDLLLFILLVTPAAARLETATVATTDLKRRNAEAVLFQRQKTTFSGMAAGIPSQKDVPIVIRDIVQTARKLNLAVGAVNSDIPSTGNQGMAQLTFLVPVAGSYSDIKRFIYSMESTDRLIGIRDLSLKADKGRVSMSINLVTYIKGD